jgi:hypothetical protein
MVTAKARAPTPKLGTRPVEGIPRVHLKIGAASGLFRSSGAVQKRSYCRNLTGFCNVRDSN